MKGYYAAVKAILLAHKCYLVRQGKGSHEIWSNQNGNKFTVSTSCTSKITADAIMKQAGIKHKF